MSNQNPRSTFQSASYSFSSVSINGSTTSRSEATYSDPQGKKVWRKAQDPGEAPRVEHVEYDSSGRRLEGASPAQGAIENRIEDVTEEEDGKSGAKGARFKERMERDPSYEERMEDEYAKREGGA